MEVQAWNVCGFPENGRSTGDRGGVCVSRGPNDTLLLLQGIFLGSSISTTEKPPT